MKITEVLVAEHAILRRLFDQVEAELPGITTLETVALLARLIEKLLMAHGETEEDLLLCALDHTLEDRSQRERMYQEHRELDDRFCQIQTAPDVLSARRLFHSALMASRNHFRYEEEMLFPFANRALGADLLQELGQSRELTRSDNDAGEAIR